VKIVLDTNVLIAAFATQGLCHAVFELCLDRHEIVLSTDILREAADAFKRKLKVPPQTIQSTIKYLKEHAQIIQTVPLSERVSRDPKDDHVLALAAQAGADYIVTGDEDLLVLGKHGGIPIVQPRQFWEKMKNKERRNR
jgi:uncharacterized protein